MRQDLYACRKCTEQANGRYSGFCAGCRQSCHSDHPDEVFELYTKRAFRCDCGNKRARNICKLQPDKDDVNVGNERTYSHNFDSRYCRCDREYDYNLPMAQCAMCEDWFHEECYKTDSRRRGNETQPYSTEYELTCKDCVKTLPVLAEYYESLHAWTKQSNLRVWQEARLKKGCIRPKTASVSMKAGSIDYMWRPGFRIFLCRCADCSEMYRSANCLYITDRSDFVNVVPEDDLDVFNDKPDEEVVDDDDGGADNEEEGMPSSNINDEDDGDGDGDGDGDVLMMKPAPKQRQRSVFDGDRIPRKPVEIAEDPVELQSRLNPDSVNSIRDRIFSFLNENIDKNGGKLNREEVLVYISDLKADLLATFRQKLDTMYEDE